MTVLTPKDVREVGAWVQRWCEPSDRVEVETAPPRIIVQRAGGALVYGADSIRRLVIGTGRSDPR